MPDKLRVGVIGGGQLGQMLGFAGRTLGIECEYLDPSAEPPAAAAGRVVRASFDDDASILSLASRVDVLTYEFENLSVEALEPALGMCPIFPPLAALAAAQDRLAEKHLFEKLKIPLPRWHAVSERSDLSAAAEVLGLPFVLKTRRFGYDGKGQFVLRTDDDLEAAWRTLGDAPLVAEQWVTFDREVSAIGARGTDGTTVCYPLTENLHADGILRYSRAPVSGKRLETAAHDYLSRLLDSLDYVGVLALELFAVGDALLANEFAPRVHNSGHWTIEGADPSQFANHLLAITGQPPREPALCGHAGMLNLIGGIPAAARAPDLAHATLHDYGKSPRPGRKLGHITLLAEDAASRDRALAELGNTVTGLAPDFGTRE